MHDKDDAMGTATKVLYTLFLLPLLFVLQDGNGKTPLYYAVEQRSSELLDFLLEAVSPEDIAEAVNVRMSNGATCLHVAAGLRDLADSEATEEQYKIVQLLLDNGADWKARINNQTKSKPADYAFNPRVKSFT